MSRRLMGPNLARRLTRHECDPANVQYRANSSRIFGSSSDFGLAAKAASSSAFAYDFVLDLSREELLNLARASGMAVSGPGGGEAGRASADAAADPNAVSLANSIALLGLKLEPRKLPVEVLVIDHLEKVPVAN
jgi:hypothetical protein